MLSFFSTHRYQLLFMFLNDECVQHFVLSRWANHILLTGTEVTVWYVLSCGDLIELKRISGGGTQ